MQHVACRATDGNMGAFHFTSGSQTVGCVPLMGHKFTAEGGCGQPEEKYGRKLNEINEIVEKINLQAFADLHFTKIQTGFTK